MRVDKRGRGAARAASRLSTSVAVLGLSVLVALAGCSGATSTASGPSSAQRLPAGAEYLLGEADAHGALVLDSERHAATGYDADGRQVWSQVTKDDPGTSGCVGNCPTAFLSGWVKTISSPQAADAPTIWVSASGARYEKPGISGGKPGKLIVFAAASPSTYVAYRSSLTGDAQVVLTASNHPDVILPASLHPPMVHASADNKSVVIVMQSGPQVKPKFYWYTLVAGAWKEVGAGEGTASTGCAANGGRMAALLGSSSALLTPDHRVLSLGTQGGDCGFTRRGLVTIGGRGNDASSITMYDRSGSRVWQTTVPARGSLTTSPDSDFVLVSPGAQSTTAVLVNGKGKIAKKLTSVADAWLVGHREVVTLSLDGKPQWQKF